MQESAKVCTGRYVLWWFSASPCTIWYNAYLFGTRGITQYCVMTYDELAKTACTERYMVIK